MDQQRSVGLLGLQPISVDIPPSSPQWIINILIRGHDGSIPQGPPTDQVKISLCEDGDPDGDLFAGSIPGTVLESQTFTVTAMSPDDPENYQFILNTKLTVGQIYWMLLERTGSIAPTTDPNYQLYDIDPSGGDPAVYALLYDSSSGWFDLTGETSFALTGTNLPPGANIWTGDNNTVSTVFGNASGTKFAEKFIA